MSIKSRTKAAQKNIFVIIFKSFTKAFKYNNCFTKAFKYNYENVFLRCLGPTFYNQNPVPQRKKYSSHNKNMSILSVKSHNYKIGANSGAHPSHLMVSSVLSHAVCLFKSWGRILKNNLRKST